MVESREMHRADHMREFCSIDRFFSLVALSCIRHPEVIQSIPPPGYEYSNNIVLLCSLAELMPKDWLYDGWMKKYVTKDESMQEEAMIPN